jgi:GGDEF domain-containing protein
MRQSVATPVQPKPGELLAAVSELTKTINALLALEPNAEVLQARQQLGALLSGVISQVAGEALQPQAPVYTLDQLTGLPSRASAEAQLREAHTQSQDCFLALFVVKRLALINAKFGYARGDDVLKKVVVHLSQSLQESANLFRWAPCAFLALAPESTSYKELRSKIQMIELARLTPTLEWEGRSAMVPIIIDCRIVPVKDFSAAPDLFLHLDTLASDA